jgi:hypothetical protein
VCHFHRHLAPSVDLNKTTSTGLSVEQLSRIFYDFKDLHWSWISAIVHARIFHSGGFRSFSYASQFFAFDLSYRDDCSGNPARAFYPKAAELLPRAILDATTLAAIDASKNSQDTSKTHRRADPEFVDILPVMFMFREQRLIQPIAIYDQAEIIQYCVNDADYFLKQLRQLSDRGHAYRDVGIGKLFPGRMIERGEKWQWVPLTEQEVAAGNYVLMA